jgi:hypothetical protein
MIIEIGSTDGLTLLSFIATIIVIQMPPANGRRTGRKPDLGDLRSRRAFSIRLAGCE